MWEICPRCTAIVYDLPAHEAWHAALTLALTTPSEPTDDPSQHPDEPTSSAELEEEPSDGY